MGVEGGHHSPRRSSRPPRRVDLGPGRQRRGRSRRAPDGPRGRSGGPPSRTRGPGEEIGASEGPALGQGPEAHYSSARPGPPTSDPGRRSPSCLEGRRAAETPPPPPPPPTPRRPPGSLSLPTSSAQPLPARSDWGRPVAPTAVPASAEGPGTTCRGGPPGAPPPEDARAWRATRKGGPKANGLE